MGVSLVSNGITGMGGDEKAGSEGATGLELRSLRLRENKTFDWIVPVKHYVEY